MYYWETGKKTISTLVAFTTVFFNKGVIPNSKVIAQPMTQCNLVGIVLTNGDRQKSASSTLCEGDRLNILPGREVEVYCINSGQKFVVSGTSTKFCPVKSDTIDERSCSEGDSSRCPKTKGPGEAHKPTLVSPYGTVLVDGRPTFKWHPVGGATSYTVEVSGSKVDWGKKVENTKLPYPKDQPELQSSNTYKIVIIANQEKLAINNSIAAVTMLSKSDIEQLQKIAQQIESLSLPKEKEVFYLDSLYMSRSLLDQSINFLKTQVVNSQDPRLHRILGDRYLEAGVANLAQEEYQTAKVLAKDQEDLVELKKAQAGLNLIAHYNQLPTKTKPAQ